MWRSIAARPSLTRNWGRKLLPLQHPHAQVLFKPQKSSLHPREFPHQNHRILSYSSISDSSSCSKDLKVEDGGDFDGTHVNVDTQMGCIGSEDDNLETNTTTSTCECFFCRINRGNLIRAPFENSVTNTNFSKWYHLWNVLCEGLVDDESLECTLDSLDLCLAEEFMLIVVKRLHSPYFEHSIRFLKWAFSRKEFRANTTPILEEIGDLINQYGDTKYVDVDALWELVKEVGEKENGLLNAKILDDFLFVFSYFDNEKGAFEVYLKFEEFGCIPSGDTYYHTIKTLCRQFAYDVAISVCRKMLDTEMLPEELGQVLEIIGLLCKGDRAKEALAVYRLAAKYVDEDYRLSLVNSLSNVVRCLTKADETVHLAQEILLGDSPAEYRKYVHNSFLWVIRGLCRKNDIESAKKLLFEMIEKGPPPGNEVFHSVIVCLTKTGDLEDAWEILKLAETRGLSPKLSSYDAIVSGYAEVGSMEEACKVLLAAKNKHTKLSPTVLYVLIQGYCTRGEVDKALRLFFDLKSYGVVLSFEAYDKLIQLFSLCLKDLDLETAQKLLEEMREKGLYLPHITEGIKRVVNELQLGMVIGSRSMWPAQHRELNPVVV